MDENKELKHKINILKREIKELNEKYNELVKKYVSQNNELTLIKVFLSKEGYIEDKYRITKK
jgi:hypothetical protein